MMMVGQKFSGAYSHVAGTLCGGDAGLGGGKKKTNPKKKKEDAGEKKILDRRLWVGVGGLLVVDFFVWSVFGF